MIIAFSLIWFISGILGILIYNKIVTYESIYLKYIWNTMVFLCGVFGLFTAILTWFDSLMSVKLTLFRDRISKYLDDKIDDIDSYSYLTYEIIDENTIKINYGWMDNKYDDDTNIVCKLGNKIKINLINSGHSCISGNYEDSTNFKFNNLKEFISWLDEEIVTL